MVPTCETLTDGAPGSWLRTLWATAALSITAISVVTSTVELCWLWIELLPCVIEEVIVGVSSSCTVAVYLAVAVRQ